MHLAAPASYRQVFSILATGIGNFTQSGGSNTASLYIGYGTGARGTYTLSGTGRLFAGAEEVGYSGNGDFAQSGGSNTMSLNLDVGYGGGTGTDALSNSGQLSAYSEHVGEGGVGTFTQSGGRNMFQILFTSGSTPAQLEHMSSVTAASYSPRASMSAC